MKYLCILLVVPCSASQAMKDSTDSFPRYLKNHYEKIEAVTKCTLNDPLHGTDILFRYLEDHFDNLKKGSFVCYDSYLILNNTLTVIEQIYHSNKRQPVVHLKNRVLNHTQTLWDLIETRNNSSYNHSTRSMHKLIKEERYLQLIQRCINSFHDKIASQTR